jgi:hypothetical protein
LLLPLGGSFNHHLLVLLSRRSPFHFISDVSRGPHTSQVI